MKIGVVREVKKYENRVSLTPVGAEELSQAGHIVLVETGAGVGSGFTDAQYAAAGAQLVAATDVWAQAELLLKVKEPQPQEIAQAWPGQVLFTYFRFAADEALTRGLIGSGAVAIAYETVETGDGRLPLLTPMSEVAGRMAVQQGAKYLEREHGGRGVLLGGVPGVPPATVVVLGAGVVGTHAAKMAAGLGPRVVIIDVNLDRLRYLSDVMPANVVTLMSNLENIRESLLHADVVISSVLIRGGKAPKLIRREHLRTMKKGAVIVDVAIDQGGSTETSRPTTHTDPIYTVDGIIHYCVANMPGAMPVTSTIALTNATLPYVKQLANKGWQRAARENPALAKGVNIAHGKVTYAAVAESFGLEHTAVEEVL